MEEPYLLIGLRIPNDDGSELDEVIQAIEQVLPADVMMELKIPNVFAVQLEPPDDFSVFKKVARTLADADGDLDGDLQWFVQLVTGEGALACN